MKRLFLIRHAKSSWKNPALSDSERPLNKRGCRDAPIMGKRLREFGADPDLIITSPAKRARRTARHIAGQVGYPENEIRVAATVYHGYIGELITVIREINDQHDEVMVVGHNPGITVLVNHLTGRKILNVPTCGVAAMDFPVRSWQEVEGDGAIFLFFDYPKRQLG